MIVVEQSDLVRPVVLNVTSASVLIVMWSICVHFYHEDIRCQVTHQPFEHLSEAINGMNTGQATVHCSLNEQVESLEDSRPISALRSQARIAKLALLICSGDRATYCNRDCI